MAPTTKSSATSSLNPVQTETASTNVAKVAPSQPVAPKAASLPTDEVTERSANGLKESDIPTAKIAAPVVQTSECKEALAERDLALEAPENSDKLFHLRRALRLCPNNAALHHELGKVYGAMERREDAESEFKQALSIDPSLSAAKNELSNLLKNEVQF
jgi:Flp pilus assembly protein TadD